MKLLRLLCLAAWAPLAVALVACGPSKVVQCNTFVQKANGIQTQIGQLAARDKPDELEKAAGSVDKLTSELSDLPLKDPRLVQYRGTYCDGLKRTSQYLRDLATLHKDLPADDKKLEERQQKVRELQQRRAEQMTAEEKLAEEINDYCSGKT